MTKEKMPTSWAFMLACKRQAISIRLEPFNPLGIDVDYVNAREPPRSHSHSRPWWVIHASNSVIETLRSEGALVEIAGETREAVEHHSRSRTDFAISDWSSCGLLVIDGYAQRGLEACWITRPRLAPHQIEQPLFVPVERRSGSSPVRFRRDAAGFPPPLRIAVEIPITTVAPQPVPAAVLRPSLDLGVWTLLASLRMLTFVK
jgi:hypothetical protein